MNLEKQIGHWREGALEALGIASILIGKDKLIYGLFFCHLAVEKILKAAVIKETQDYPPRTHNLIALAEKCKLAFSDNQENLLGTLMEFQLQGRYPDLDRPKPTFEFAETCLRNTKELVEWLSEKL